MDFYLSLGGEKAGPFSIFKVGELLESGEATPDTLAWHRGLDEWRPIHEIPALEAVRERSLPPSPPERPSPPPLPDPAHFPPQEPFPGAPLPEVGPVVVSAAVAPSRPFVRFWARMFDFTLVYTLVSGAILQSADFVIKPPQPGEGTAEFFARYFEELSKPEAMLFARTFLLSLVGWHALEGILVHLFGATPGKALFGLKVKALDGTRVPLLPSLGRSFYAYVLGVGFYQFPFILIGMVFSFFRLTSTGQCLWDQHLKTRVEQPPLGPARIVLAICAFFVLLILQSVRIS